MGQAESWCPEVCIASRGIYSGEPVVTGAAAMSAAATPASRAAVCTDASAGSNTAALERDHHNGAQDPALLLPHDRRGSGSRPQVHQRGCGSSTGAATTFSSKEAVGCPRTQHEDLELLGFLEAYEQRHQLEHGPQREVEEREDQDLRALACYGCGTLLDGLPEGLRWPDRGFRDPQGLLQGPASRAIGPDCHRASRGRTRCSAPASSESRTGPRPAMAGHTHSPPKLLARGTLAYTSPRSCARRSTRPATVPRRHM